MKTDCFLQGLDWLTLKEVEEEERGRNNTYTRAMGRDCRSWGRRNSTKACARGGDGRSKGRGRGRTLGGGATGAEPGRGGKSSSTMSRMYSVQREVKQNTRD